MLAALLAVMATGLVAALFLGGLIVLPLIVAGLVVRLVFRILLFPLRVVAAVAGTVAGVGLALVGLVGFAALGLVVALTLVGGVLVLALAPLLLVAGALALVLRLARRPAPIRGT